MQPYVGPFAYQSAATTGHAILEHGVTRHSPLALRIVAQLNQQLHTYLDL